GWRRRASPCADRSRVLPQPLGGALLLLELADALIHRGLRVGRLLLVAVDRRLALLLRRQRRRLAPRRRHGAPVGVVALLQIVDLLGQRVVLRRVVGGPRDRVLVRVAERALLVLQLLVG